MNWKKLHLKWTPMSNVMIGKVHHGLGGYHGERIL